MLSIAENDIAYIKPVWLSNPVDSDGQEFHIVPVDSFEGLHDAGAAETELDSFANLDPSWANFRGSEDHEALWRRFGELRNFTFRIRFLESFRDLRQFGPTVHERTVDMFRNVTEESDVYPLLPLLRFRSEEEGENHGSGVIIEDDYWDGAIFLLSDNSLIWRKESSDFRTLHATAPRWLAALKGIAADPQFAEVLGPKQSRVTQVSIHLTQRFRLDSIFGPSSRRNSQLMEEFLTLKTDRLSPAAVLSTMGVSPTTLTRADLKLGWRLNLKGHEYLCWLTISAPANDRYSIINLEWEIQDRSPGCIVDRDYADVITEVIRDQIFYAFYRRWFVDNNVPITSERR